MHDDASECSTGIAQLNFTSNDDFFFQQPGQGSALEIVKEVKGGIVGGVQYDVIMCGASAL